MYMIANILHKLYNLCTKFGKKNYLDLPESQLVAIIMHKLLFSSLK